MIGVQWDLKLRLDWGLFLGLVPGTDMIERKNERTNWQLHSNKCRWGNHVFTGVYGGEKFRLKALLVFVLYIRLILVVFASCFL
jgi:hypothetical protein